MMLGSRSSSRCLTGVDRMAPPEVNTNREVSSASVASMASSSGRAKESPTNSNTLASSRAIRSTTDGASKRSTTSGTITVPPLEKLVKAAQCAAPCMKGGAGTVLTGLAVVAAATRASIDSHSSGLPKGRPPSDAAWMSAWRHMTPLGMPVVPPV